MYVVRITDGIGNQIFQYAFAKSLQIMTGKKVYLDVRYINNEDIIQNRNSYFLKQNDKREYRLNNFKISIPIANDNMLKIFDFSKKSDFDLLNVLFSYSEEKRGEIVLPSLFSTYFQGYYFDKSYYERIRNVLKKEISLNAPVRCDSILYKSVYNDKSVGIHIRRGDFLKLDRDISDSDYYKKAVKYMESFIDNPIFIVFTDDPEWTKDNTKYLKNVVYVSDYNLKDYEELMLIKHCRHNIIANSTFSYWGAYLNVNKNSVTVCPRGWRTSIIPENWISI